jgi:hypothetical protein
MVTRGGLKFQAVQVLRRFCDTRRPRSAVITLTTSGWLDYFPAAETAGSSPSGRAGRRRTSIPRRLIF